MRSCARVPGRLGSTLTRRPDAAVVFYAGGLSLTMRVLALELPAWSVAVTRTLARSVLPRLRERVTARRARLASVRRSRTGTLAAAALTTRLNR
jgi:hypothetical protein